MGARQKNLPPLGEEQSREREREDAPHTPPSRQPW